MKATTNATKAFDTRRAAALLNATRLPLDAPTPDAAALAARYAAAAPEALRMALVGWLGDVLSDADAADTNGPLWGLLDAFADPRPKRRAALAAEVADVEAATPRGPEKEGYALLAACLTPAADAADRAGLDAAFASACRLAYFLNHRPTDLACYLDAALALFRANGLGG